MRHMNRVTAQQADTFMNTHFGHNINKLEITYGQGKRIEYFAKGICIGSYVVAYGMLEYLIH